MADNGENILVEFDYDNITLIDPNKLVDDQGNVTDRLVKQEDLVYYVNLECNVLPRTKLAVGTAMNDSQRTISVGKINFLNPGFKTFMDNAWADELTGKNTLQGKGVNQPSLTSVKNPNKSDDYYITQNLSSNGTPGAVDNGLLGMKLVKVSVGLDFLPVVDVDLEDVKGRALFEGGNNSPYAAFFQLPYPQFTLTIKGYYGKAVKMPIMLQSFTSTFDPATHNFQVKLKFYGYKYTLLSYINFGALMAVPHMYNNKVSQTTRTADQGNANDATTLSTPTIVSRGYQKMKEIYSIYKSKGLIDDNFPEITLNQLKYRLSNFIKDILDKFAKENLGALTEMTNYTNELLGFQQKVFIYTTSWYNKYMDTKNPIVLKSTGESVYNFKKELNTEKREAAIAELGGYLTNYNLKLSENKIFGIKGSYTVGTTVIPSEIPNSITIDTLTRKIASQSDVDFEKTYLSQQNTTQGTIDPIKFETFKTNLSTDILLAIQARLYYFDGPNSFISITNDMAKQASTIRNNCEKLITENLAAKFNDPKNGLGFMPSIRNILAIFYCQGEAFLGLLDEVHKKAWDQRENPYRRAAIFGNITTAPSVDVKTSTQNNEPIYPWPQVIQETIGSDKQEKFEVVYPGAQNVASAYRAYNPEIWPEVEFVEQFIKGYTERLNSDDKGGESNVIDTQPSRISLNAIDFPVTNEVFQNKEESKYYYEIYERILVNSLYSRMNRVSGYDLSIYEAEGDDEATNVLKSLGTDNPFLSKNLKEYLVDGTNFVPFLRHISNEGQGDSWQSFIRGEFVTPYLKNESQNPNLLYNSDLIQSLKSQPNLSLSNTKNLNNLEQYFANSSSSNKFDFTDTYPLSNLKWDKNNLAYGKYLNNVEESFDTKMVLSYNNIHKTLTNFLNSDTNNDKRPFTHFNFENTIVTPTTETLKDFYNTRKYEDQVVTEGNLEYVNYTNNWFTPNQTTSMLNTPYFINAIQQGVFNFRYKQGDKYPYKTAAYLFLNSLPLGTLREKYKTLKDGAVSDLDYILSTLKKFGAVHKLPYAWILKYGAIWHRYKVYKESGEDILDPIWKNFNYLENWDPVNSAATKSFNLLIDGTQRDIVLENTTGNQPFTDINTGFYPQLTDDFNVFLQGLKLFSGQTQVTGKCVITPISGDCTTFDVSGTCSMSGTVLTVNTINYNFIKPNVLIQLPSLSATTSTLSQISGSSGGTGTYVMPISITATNINFVIKSYAKITNLTSSGITSGTIIVGPSTNGPLTLGVQVTGSTNGNGTYLITPTTAITSNFVVANSPLKVTAIDSNVLSANTILNGASLNGNVTILSQLSGINGGIGTYSISSGQTATTSNFIVANAFLQGIGSSQIQPLITSGKLKLINTTNSTIFETPGFDPNNGQRSMRVTPWSVVVRTTDGTGYYVLPSFGSNINQTKVEAFKNGTMKVELLNNNAMFNGSVRLFWNAPQYGWFDNDKVVKNNPETYMKEIFNTEKLQQNFLITGNQTKYTNIEELFTTFDIQTLDSFESEFLNFSRSVYDYVDTLPTTTNSQTIQLANQDANPNATTELISDKGNKNFQYLMRELFKVKTPTGTSPETILSSVITSQNDNFQQILTNFVNYNVVFKYGNPSMFDRRLFLTFSNKFLEDPIIYGPYENGTLPTQGGSLTLANSKQQSPETWKALEYYVGNSTIPKLIYSNNGSYITDFFVDLNVQFNEKNVVDFAPLIKIYASQKLVDNNLNLTKFYGLMNAYFDQSDAYIFNVINVMMPQVRKELPTVFIEGDGSTNRAGLEAGFTEQTRTELWETFKALNDTWISGYDFKNKTLFEDVMLVDRASRNVGDKILVDIFEIQNLIEGGTYKNNLLDIVTTILVQNNFQHFMLPSYVNFYNVQDALKNPTPKPDGSLDFANTLFGTFLNVDYRNSSPKFLCFYANKPSEHLDMKDNIDYRYRDDAFDLRRASDNPLIENQMDKKDWANSNKVVGFNIDITSQNQQIFKQFSISQTPGKPTSESLEMLNQMSNMSRNTRSSTQSVSLYNLYKNRSYDCSVDMMGCALIQPMMYFNVRNIPMFSGPYMIRSVTHNITESGFETTFDGSRQPFYSLPKIDNFLQTLNVKLLSTIEDKIKEKEQKNLNSSDNILNQQENVLANIKANEQLTKNQDCALSANPRYYQYTAIDVPAQTSKTSRELYNDINTYLTSIGLVDDKLVLQSLIMFTFIYVDSGNSTGISAYENNYSTIDLTQTYGDAFTSYIDKKYYCVSRGTNRNLPIAKFTSFNTFIQFVFERTKGLVDTFTSTVGNSGTAQSSIDTLSEIYVTYYPIKQNQDVWSKMSEQNVALVKQEFKEAFNLFDSLKG
jgi:hypothetical protein